MEFKDEDRILNDDEIDWLMNKALYLVGSISSKDLKVMGHSLKKSFDALKNFGDLNELKIEDSTWCFVAVETIIEVFESRESKEY